MVASVGLYWAITKQEEKNCPIALIFLGRGGLTFDISSISHHCGVFLELFESVGHGSPA